MARGGDALKRSNSTMLTFETHGSIKKIYQGIKSKKQNAIKKYPKQNKH